MYTVPTPAPAPVPAVERKPASVLAAQIMLWIDFAIVLSAAAGALLFIFLGAMIIGAGGDDNVVGATLSTFLILIGVAVGVVVLGIAFLLALTAIKLGGRRGWARILGVVLAVGMGLAQVDVGHGSLAPGVGSDVFKVLGVLMNLALAVCLILPTTKHWCASRPPGAGSVGPQQPPAPPPSAGIPAQPAGYPPPPGYPAPAPELSPQPQPQPQPQPPTPEPPAESGPFAPPR